MDRELTVELNEVNERYERRKAQNREAQRKFRSKIIAPIIPLLYICSFGEGGLADP